MAIKQLVTQASSLSQSSLMGAAVIGGFILYLAAQGKLANYWSILTGGSGSGSSSGGSSSAAPIGPTVGSTNPDGSTTLIPPLIPGFPNLGLTFKFTNPFGPGGTFGPPATPPAAGGK